MYYYTYLHSVLKWQMVIEASFTCLLSLLRKLNYCNQLILLIFQSTLLIWYNFFIQTNQKSTDINQDQKTT